MTSKIANSTSSFGGSKIHGSPSSNTITSNKKKPHPRGNSLSMMSSGVSIVMRLNRTWDVCCPPAKKKVVAGKLVPTVKSIGGFFIKKKRRIAIEIHGPEFDNDDVYDYHEDDDDEDDDHVDGDDGDVARTTVNRDAGGRLLRGLKRTQGHLEVVDLSKELRDDDILYIRILKPRNGRWGFHRDPDDSSDSEDDDDDNDHDNDYNNDKDKENIKTKTKVRPNASVEDGVSSAAVVATKWMQDTAAQTMSMMMQNEQDSGDWIEYRRYGMDEIDEVEVRRNVWEATMGLGEFRERREIVFPDHDQAQDFQKQLVKLSALVKERAQQRLEAYQRIRAETQARVEEQQNKLQMTAIHDTGGATSLFTKFIPSSLLGSGNNWTGMSIMDTSSDVSLLVEIVSASDLPVADSTSTDPYIVVFMGKQIIHKTKAIPKELNPVWTVDTGSLFIASCSAEEFFSFASGLTFCIKDYDSVSKDELVAQVSVSQNDLLQMNGERVTLDLKVPRKLMNKRNWKKLYAPKLNLRVRKARHEDKTFIKTLNSRRKKEGVLASTCFASPTRERVGFFKRETKFVDGVTLHRVKPCPDPTRPEQETKWLPLTRIDEEVIKPSYSWVEAGTGSIGKMYVEILKCDDLPNMDCKIGDIETGFTDAFCCIIFEDSIVNTDVIRDDLNPRWVPWSQRAFVFNVAHPSSQLLIGVFDYDVNRTGLGSHDKIGRISVDVTNFHPDTEYILTYNLFASVLDNNRSPNGKLTIRLRMEYESFKEYASGTLKLPPLNYINLAKKSDFRTAYFVCNGEENINRFSMEDLTAYRTELVSLVGLRYYISQAILTVVFWRGHKEVKISGTTIKLPLHSVVAFVMGTTLIENFNLLPSYCLFSIAWLLAGTNELRQQNPSPWHGSMTIAQMWYALIFDRVSPENIADHENEAAVRAYEERAQRRQEEEEAILKQRQEQVEAVSEFLRGGSTQPEDVSDDHETKLGGRPMLNPLAVALFPLQQILGQTCRVVRILRSIIMWDESYMAFLIVNVCMVTGIALLWVPWSFFTRWIARLLIWTLLGPWMALVDWYVLPRVIGDNEDKDEALRKLARTEFENFGQAKELILRRREDVLKHRAMKRYMFGKFAVKVPQFKEYRYRDVPLPESSARRVHGYRDIKVIKRTNGQTLVGDMIPKWGEAVCQGQDKKDK